MPELIRIQLRAGGKLTDVLGEEPIEYGLAPPAHVCNLTELVYLKYPALADWSGRVGVEVNDEPAGAERPLQDGDTVRLIPR